MRKRTTWQPWKWASLVLTGGLLVGCSTSEKTLQYLGQAELQHYKDVALTIDYPDVNEESLAEVTSTDEPHRIRNPHKDPVWNLSFEEALHTALANSEVIRDNGQFLSPGNRLLANPDFVQSMYDPAIQDSSTLFGQNGVEAALSEFDANFTANMTWGRSENLSDSVNASRVPLGGTFANEAADMRAALTKIFADGGQASLIHNVSYQGFNGSAGAFGDARLFNSSYSNSPGAGQNGGTPGLEFDYRRPLWAGSGTEFTRISGPISRRPTLQNVPQVNQGVVISRIRTDIALAEFEQAVIGLAKDVEDVYWELYLAYRRYDAELVARNSSLSTWRQVKAKADEGLEGGGAADEAQARDSYFEIRARSEDALANLYNAEGRLRRLMGLAVNDGRVIRPSDEPTTAEFLPDWRTSLTEALTHRVELRKQKWNIKSLEFQLQAAKSLAQPRLDFVSRYQINGLGDQLFGDSKNSTTSVPGSYYENLLSGQQTGWGLGFEFSMPIGFRAANSQIRNIELRLSKARAALGIQEHEISHELANAFRQLDSSFQIAQTTFNRRRAAERRVQAHDTQYKAGKGTVDLLLRSQISLAQAEVAYYQSLVGYNRAIVEMKFRKGTLLDNDNVRLSESLSHPESYAQALRHAWARSYAFDAQHLDTKPAEFWTDSAETGTATYSASDFSRPIPAEPAPAIEQPDANSAPMTKEAPRPTERDSIPPPPVPATERPDANSAPMIKEAPRPTERDSIPPPPTDIPDATGAALIPVDEELLPVASKRDLPEVPVSTERRVERSHEDLPEVPADNEQESTEDSADNDDILKPTPTPHEPTANQEQEMDGLDQQNKSSWQKPRGRDRTFTLRRR